MPNSSGTHHRHKKNMNKMSREEKRVEFTRQNLKMRKKNFKNDKRTNN